MAKEKGWTLHARLTRRCNAQCDYCSSFREGETGAMNVDEYRKSLDFIARLLNDPRMGVNTKERTLVIQYVGGEVLTIPAIQMRQIVLTGRQWGVGAGFKGVIDGVQSNLIGPPDRIAALNNLFGARISTSVEHTGLQRKINGSGQKYIELHQHGRSRLARRGVVPARIFVVDRKGLPDVDTEIELAMKAKADIRLRPVFEGGSDIDSADVSDMATVFAKTTRDWLLTGEARLEPAYQLLTSRLDLENTSGACPYCNQCTTRSLNLDPNGDLFLCLDFSDANHKKIGNALTGEFDWSVLESLGSRSKRLPDGCLSCPWVASCRGGCMLESWAAYGSLEAKTPLCEVWKSMFAEIDLAIEKHGAEALVAWIKKMDAHYQERTMAAIHG